MKRKASEGPIGVKLPGHRPGPFDEAHGPEHVEGLPGKVISFSRPGRDAP